MKLKHDLCLGKNFPRFKYCDALLTTDGSRSLPVHRAIIATVSPKLEALFDSNSSIKTPLVVEHVDFENLERVIESIYSGEITLEDNRTDDLVTEAFEKLQIGLIIVPERTIGDTVQTEIGEIKDVLENNKCIESEARELKVDIDNNNDVVIDGNVHSHNKDTCTLFSKILDSSLEHSSSLNDQVTSCLDLDLIASPSKPDDDPVWKEGNLRVRKNLFKISPPCVEKEESCSISCSASGPIIHVDIVKNIEHQEKTGEKNKNIAGENKSSQLGLEKELSQGQNLTANHLFILSPYQQESSQHSSQRTQNTEQAEARNKKIQQDIVNLQETEEIVILGTKKNTKRKPEESHSKTRLKKGKFQNNCKEKNKHVVTSVRSKTLSLSSHLVLPQSRLAFMNNSRIRIRNPFLTFGGTGKGPGKFRGPLAIAVDEDQLTYVLDSGNRRIQVFNQDCSPLFQFGTGHLAAPNDITIARTSSDTDMILVSDKGDKDIKLFTCLSGHFIRTLGLCLTGIPAAVSANSRGTIVVAEVRKCEGTYIIVCDLSGNISGTFETSAAPCSLYSGLLVTNNGKIFIPNMTSRSREEFLVYHYQEIWFRRLGFQLQGQVVGISEVGQELLVASMKDALLRLTLYKYDSTKGKWTIFFMLDSDQKLPFVPCSFSLLSFSPILRVVVGDKQNNLHVLAVRKRM